MHIVFTNPVGELGGGELSLCDVIISVHEAFPDSKKYLVLCSDGPLSKHVTNLGIPNLHVIVLPLSKTLSTIGDSYLKSPLQKVFLIFKLFLGLLSGLRYIYLFRQTISALQPTLVHSNGLKTHLLTGLACSSKVSVIWHMRDFLSNRIFMSKALRLIARKNVTMVANSAAVADDIRKVLPLVPIEVVYNGIDVKYFSPGSSTLFNSSFNSTDIRVGLVATYARWKGQDIFLRAIREWRRLSPKSSSAQFFVIGGPIYHTKGSQFSADELQKLAMSLGISDIVHFIEFQKDTASVYRSLDLVIHASTRPEPFGRTIVEAMSCGRPIIASKAGGAVELFSDGEGGIFVPPNDPARLAYVIKDLIESPEKLKSLSLKSREIVLKRFSRERLKDELARVYKKINFSLELNSK